jgi:hypothetical protein
MPAASFERIELREDGGTFRVIFPASTTIPTTEYLAASDRARRLCRRGVEQVRERAALERIYEWLLCHSIATPEDMAQSFEEMTALAARALGVDDHDRR